MSVQLVSDFLHSMPVLYVLYGAGVLAVLSLPFCGEEGAILYRVFIPCLITIAVIIGVTVFFDSVFENKPLSQKIESNNKLTQQIKNEIYAKQRANIDKEVKKEESSSIKSIDEKDIDQLVEQKVVEKLKAMEESKNKQKEKSVVIKKEESWNY